MEEVLSFFLLCICCCFWFFHIFNYENTETLFYWISPLIILSQLSGGVILGYIRLKAGLFWGMLYHGLFNGIIVIIALLFYHNVATISYSDKEVENFSLHELQYRDKHSAYSEIKWDSKGNLTEVHCNDISLKLAIRELGIEKELKSNNCWINLDIVAPKGVSKEKVLGILEKEYKFERKKK